MYKSRMQNRDVDLVIYGDKGQALLLAEVKGRADTSPQWAAQYRMNLLSHGTLPHAPYFLIAAADYLYFLCLYLGSMISSGPLLNA